ncbi:MAG: protein YgfX [Gallionellaceae bacterium]
MRPQKFTLHASNSLTIFLIFAHSIAMVSIAFIPLPMSALIALSTILLVSMIYFILRYALLMLGSAWVALSCDDGEVELVNRKGNALRGVLLNSSLATPLCVVLNVAIQERWLTQSVVVMADSMEAESFRQLSVVLKWQVSVTA